MTDRYQLIPYFATLGTLVVVFVVALIAACIAPGLIGRLEAFGFGTISDPRHHDRQDPTRHDRHKAGRGPRNWSITRDIKTFITPVLHPHDGSKIDQIELSLVALTATKRPASDK